MFTRRTEEHPDVNLKATHIKFIGSIRGKFGGEITKYHSGRFTVQNDKQMREKSFGGLEGRGKGQKYELIE